MFLNQKIRIFKILFFIFFIGLMTTSFQKLFIVMKCITNVSTLIIDIGVFYNQWYPLHNRLAYSDNHRAKYS